MAWPSPPRCLVPDVQPAAAKATDAHAELQPSGSDDGSTTDSQAEPDPANAGNVAPKCKRKQRSSAKADQQDAMRYPKDYEPVLDQRQQDIYEEFCPMCTRRNPYQTGCVKIAISKRRH